MRYSAVGLISINFLFSCLLIANGSPDSRYVCSFCLIALGLVEESALQIHLENALISQCNDSNNNLLCQRAVKELILSLSAKMIPEELCAEMSVCTQECTFWSSWPVNPLPEQPPEWPIERRLLSEKQNVQSVVKATSLMKENIMEMDIPRDLKILKPIFEQMMISVPEEWGMWAQVTASLGHLLQMNPTSPHHQNLNTSTTDYPDECGMNITCKIDHIIDHKPLQDHDGDYYALPEAKRLRGSNWRGYDCDDQHNNVYPGRKAISSAATVSSIDHNCNGISGHNKTGLYEDLFCANSQPRGIAILGDSATAHFHIPPQWLTAQGWNLNQLIPDALNEIDVPHCSWGTGHVASLKDCPYQYPIPGMEANQILSLYSQLRQRNRCNHNDFQNIGVNGARVTSSMQLVNALARDPLNDLPLLVYFALIGNDICNGHPNFHGMTKPNQFYEKAMETLTALDNKVPANSYVVAVGLFDGELLYATMHNHIHPTGTKYQTAYDFMNCLEENPCWGWLNSNETVRRISTVWSDTLNLVYQNISNTQSFKNFQFIFYNPKWSTIFEEYVTTGRPLTDLIEPTDGFHPSQTGNALFAKHFFAFLEEGYPEAIGPINPYNDEIDAMFFSTPSTTS